MLAPKLPLETPGCSLSTENLFTVSPALGYTERYGQYVVPAVCAMLEGEAVPPWIYVENEIITKANIDKYYSQ